MHFMICLFHNKLLYLNIFLCLEFSVSGLECVCMGLVLRFRISSGKKLIEQFYLDGAWPGTLGE